nr:hypothetical protein [Tanacetum cinerariifolium]
VPLFDTMLIQQGEGSGTPTEPHNTPSPEATSSHHTTSSIPLPSIPTAPIPTITQTDTTPIIQYSKRARIAQSSALPTVADEPASPVRDVSQGEACPTDSGLIADQDMATITKSSTLPRDSAPRVTFPAGEEGSMQQTLNELTAFCTSLQRQHLELLAKFQAQEVEINRLKERVNILEDQEGVIRDKSGDDARIKGRSTNEEEAPVERISNDSEEIARVLTSMDAATILAGETNATSSHHTISLILLPSIPTAPIPTVTQTDTTPIIQYSRRARIAQSSALPTVADEPASPVRDDSQREACPTDSGFIADQDRVTIAKSSTLPLSTGSEVGPTASLIVRRRKGKEIPVESDTPKKKKIQEQIDAQMARELEEQ